MTSKIRMALALAAAFVVSFGVTAAYAAPGNNAAKAKLCQKGGWQSLYTSSGATFTSEENCVSYAAQGGTLATAPQETQAQIDCAASGGTYSNDPATDLSRLPGTFLWSCNNSPETFYPTLVNDCLALGGGTVYGRADTDVGLNWSCLR